MGEFRATLYDVFGYFLPGAIVLGGICLTFALIGSPRPELTLVPLSAPTISAVGLILSYVLGHVVHALGNAVPGFSVPPEIALLSANGLPAELVARAEDRLKHDTGVDLTKISKTELFALIDETRLVRGKAGDRAMYVYREGFYRGMAVATAILMIPLAGLLFRGSLSITLEQSKSLLATRRELALTLLVSCACVVAYYFRMRRFGRYRIQRAVYQYILAAPRERTRR